MPRALLLCALSWYIAGCANFSSSSCSADGFCPAGRVCSALGTCVLPQQIDACTDLADGADCEFPGSEGTCLGGLCLAATCGDGLVTNRELCDGEISPTCGEVGYGRGVLQCTEACSLDTSGCDGVGWGLVQLPLFSGQFESVWVAPDGTLFAAYSVFASLEFVERGVLRLDTAGVITITKDIDVIALWGRSSSEVYGVGATGVFAFDGSTWNQVEELSLVESNSRRIWGDSQRVFVPGFSFDGTSWQAEDQDEVPTALYEGVYYATEADSFVLQIRTADGVWSSDAGPTGIGGELFVVDGRLMIVRMSGKVYTLGASTWSETFDLGTSVADSWQDGSGAIFAAGVNGDFFQISQGVAWLRSPDVVVGEPKAVGSVGGKPVIAYTSALAMSTGTHIASRAAPNSADVFLWAANRSFTLSGGSLFSAGFLGSWYQPKLSPFGSGLCAAWGRSESDAVVVSTVTRLVHRFDGNSWNEIALPSGFSTPDKFCSVWADDTRYWFGGAAGSLYSFDGTNWTDHSISDSGNVVALAGASDGVVALVDADGNVNDDEPNEIDRVYRLVGSDWTVIHADSGLRGVFALPSDADVLIAGTRSVRVRGNSVLPLTMPADVDQTLLALSGTSMSDVFALTVLGNLVHFNGTGWGRIRGDFTGTSRIHATPGEIYLGGFSGSVALARLVPWVP